MKLRKKMISMLLAGAMTMTMFFGTSLSAMADPGNGTEGDATIKIEKSLEMAEGITTPDETFNFTITALSYNDSTADLTKVPAIDTKAITYSAADKGSLSNGKVTVPKTAVIDLSQVEFPNAGVYKYTVKEAHNESEDTNGESYGMDYSDVEYTLSVYVGNTKDGLAVTKILANNNAISGEEGKATKLAFTNTYTKRGNEEGDSSLVIDKTVAGTLGDQTLSFTFEVTIQRAATADEADVYTGKVGDKEYRFNAQNGYKQTVTMTHGQELVFADLPAGTRYTVTETGTTNYIPSASTVENGGQAVAASAAKGETLTVSNKLVGEKVNTTAFTNTFDDEGITPTGIITNNLPYIMLVVIAAAGIAVYFVSRRRFNR